MSAERPTLFELYVEEAVNGLAGRPDLLRDLARLLAPYLPPHPRPLTFRFRQEFAPMAAVKVFFPVAKVPATPRDQDVAEQDIRFRVDGGEEQTVAVPLADEVTEFELPVGLKVGQRIEGTFGLIDDSPNKNRGTAPFDVTITPDLDTTKPTLAEGFALGFTFRQAWADDDAEVAGEPPAPVGIGEPSPTDETGVLIGDDVGADDDDEFDDDVDDDLDDDEGLDDDEEIDDEDLDEDTLGGGGDVVGGPVADSVAPPDPNPETDPVTDPAPGSATDPAVTGPSPATPTSPAA